jgi:hypothetical protein
LAACTWRLTPTRVLSRNDPDVVRHKALIAEIEPHIYGAVSAYWRVIEAEQAAKVSQFSLDQLPLGIAWLRQDGTVIHANRTAREVFDEHDGLMIVNGRLNADQASKALEEASKSIAVGETSLVVPRRSGGSLFRCCRPQLNTVLAIQASP